MLVGEFGTGEVLGGGVLTDSRPGDFSSPENKLKTFINIR
jgi:hypothetical protein